MSVPGQASLDQLYYDACTRIGAPTLEYRGRDSLDFYDVSVGNIKHMLYNAYMKGRADGLDLAFNLPHQEN